MNWFVKNILGILCYLFGILMIPLFCIFGLLMAIYLGDELFAMYFRTINEALNIDCIEDEKNTNQDEVI